MDKIEAIEAKLQAADIMDSAYLASVIVAEARKFWVECPNDFCLQATSGYGIVFGSVNRVVWTIGRGFRCERSYCTKSFKTNFDAIMKG